MFVGNNFPRKILFFLLKIITMQVQPMGIYYCTYYKNKEVIEDYDQNQILGKAVDTDAMHILQDDVYSTLNESLISRGWSTLEFGTNSGSRNVL